MKKSNLIVILALLTFMPTFANSWSNLDSTCSRRFSFFGLVSVYSGSIRQGEYDDFGNPTGQTRYVDCTSDGNWDWFN